MGYFLGYRFNTTHSIPYGLYKISNSPITRNAYVIFCPPDKKAFRIAKERHYVSAGFCPNGYSLFMKEVIGIPGDSYEFTQNGLILNHVFIENTKPINEDKFHRKLPIFYSKGILKNDEYILMGREVPNSYDARYYGLINSNNISNTILPIFVSNKRY